MKIAIATKDFATIASHAGKTAEWLMFDAQSGAALPPPRRITLEKEQLIHYFDDEGPHPLDGADVVVTASAGDGFIRHMAKRGARVVQTGETDPLVAVNKLLADQPLAEARFDVTRVFCKVRDLFSEH